MLTAFQLISLVSIVLVTFAGGYFPLFHEDRAKNTDGFPLGEAFTAGVFLALALTLMLPSASHLLTASFPKVDYPIASIIVIASFLFLLGLEQITRHIHPASATSAHQLSPPSIPIIMTVMIAIPSFFLGAALGVSETSAAVFIWVAIMTHKSSAAFALSLKMVQSTLKKNQTLIIFGLFAFSTPLGILFGNEVHKHFSSHTMVVIKGAILALAAGTFLYMSTLHELQGAPLIKNCANRKGFIVMLSGFVITALVRLIIGEAHRI